jgi:hypothetical protein
VRIWYFRNLALFLSYEIVIKRRCKLTFVVLVHGFNRSAGLVLSPVWTTDSCALEPAPTRAGWRREVKAVRRSIDIKGLGKGQTMSRISKGKGGHELLRRELEVVSRTDTRGAKSLEEKDDIYGLKPKRVCSTINIEYRIRVSGCSRTRRHARESRRTIRTSSMRKQCRVARRSSSRFGPLQVRTGYVRCWDQGSIQQKKTSAERKG